MKTEETWVCTILSFHGSFPLQKPRMPVRLIRTCFVKNRVVAEMIYHPSLLQGRILSYSGESSFILKAGGCVQAAELRDKGMRVQKASAERSSKDDVYWMQIWKG